MASFVAKHFQTIGIQASKEWLDACIDWCQGNLPNQNNQELLNAVKEQYLQTDIRQPDVQSKGVIDSQWASSNCIKYVIRQTIVLQVVKCVDIGQSAYSQLQNMLKVDTENVSVSADTETGGSNQFKAAWEPKQSRMLKFSLTDGFHEIEAIEHELINDLQYPMRPGCKLKLNPPLICRRGVILLTRKNVTNMGGEVEEMISGDTQEFRAREHLKNTLFEIIGNDNIGQFGNRALGIVTQNSRQVPTVPRQPIKEENPFDDDDDFMLQIEEPITPNIQVMPSQPKTIKKEPIIQNTKTEQPASNQIFESVMTKKTENSLTINKPFIYLSMVPKSIEDWSDNIFLVKGCVVSIAERLSVIKSKNNEGCQWKLKVIITDGSENCVVNLSGILLEDWIGCNPKKFKTANKEEKERFNHSTKDISNKLLSFNGLIKLHKMNNEPTITNLLKLNKGHLQQLKNRNTKF